VNETVFLNVPGVLMAEAALGLVCAALIALYGRTRGRDQIERWTLALVLLGLSAVFRMVAIGSAPLSGVANGISSILFVVFSLQVALGAAEHASRASAGLTRRRMILAGGVVVATAAVFATGSASHAWALAVGMGGAGALAGGAIVLQGRWHRLDLGAVVFALLATGGGAAQLVAAFVMFGNPAVDLETPVAVAVAAVVLAVVVGVLDEERMSALGMASRVEHLAYHDSLTGLPNRALFFDRLGQALAQRDRNGTRCAVLFMDLDRFKEINDSLGHAAGDEVLRVVATRMLELIRHSDTLSRFGGDEFTVLLPDIDSPDDAMRVAKKITEGVPKLMLLGGREIFVTISVGIAVAPEDGCDADVLVRNADAAMYRAKEMGRNTYRLYESSMNAESVARLDLESRMMKGLEAGEFVMHYQPVIERKTAKVVSVEALVRWAHPELGLLSPASFLPIAERSGMIHGLGAWAIVRVCRDANRIRAAYGDEVEVSTNVSAKQVLAPDFPDMLARALEESRLPGACLALEIGESAAMRDLDPLAAALGRVRGLGVRVVIDDFGSGLSSVSRLARLPHDAFKLDQELVSRLGEPGGEDLARAVINLSRTMGKPVTAEGVETDSQFSLLLGLGCDRVQGFLVGPPVALDKLVAARGEEFRTARFLKELVQRASFISLERSRPVRELVSGDVNSMN
jgi:diguanylate cyclase (GGDEF)-like protein